MAAFDLDVFGERRGRFHAALPRADAIGAAEDRRGRHRRRLGQRAAEARVFLRRALAADEFIDAPGVGGLRTSRERTAKRDHRAHAIRHHLGELSCIEAAETPTDQADLAAVLVVQFMDEIDHAMLDAFTQTEIAALPPAAHRITLAAEKAAQRTRRGIARHQPGQHQHRMAVAARRETQQRQRAEKRTELVKRAAFQEHQGSGRRRKRLDSSGHRIPHPLWPRPIGGSSPDVSVAARIDWLNRTSVAHRPRNAMLVYPS